MKDEDPSRPDPRKARAGPAQEHDQDSDPPRTAVAPGDPRFSMAARPEDHDQDSDPPLTAVPPGAPGK